MAISKHSRNRSIFRPLTNSFWKTLRWENVPWECDFYALPTFHDCTPERWHSKQKCVNTERGCVLEKWVQLMQIFHERIQSHSTCCFCDICHKYLAILGKQSRLHIGDKVRGASYSAAAAVLDWVEYNSFCQYCFGTSSL